MKNVEDLKTGIQYLLSKNVAILSAGHAFWLLRNCTRKPECMRGPVKMIILTINSRKSWWVWFYNDSFVLCVIFEYNIMVAYRLDSRMSSEIN